MKRLPLFWKIFPYYLTIIAAALILTAVYGASEMRAMYETQIFSTLKVRGMITSDNIKPLLLAEKFEELADECKHIAELSDSRLTIINANGVVLADSHQEPAQMENHSARPEIATALKNKTGLSTRYSSTLQASLMYVAVPIHNENELIGVVRVSVPVSTVESRLASFYQSIIVGGLIIIILAGFVTIFLFRKITVPLGELRDGATLFAEGNFDRQLTIPDVEEIADLSISMNGMAKQLDSRIRKVAEQRNEREAILASMSEGVLALDCDEKIMSLNRVAADLLELNLETAKGKLFYEVARLPSLIEFVDLAVAATDRTEADITLTGETERYLQVRAAMLKDNQEKRVGTVLVFNDITRLKKLEGVRREFVANVSHELKTPITAIAGSAETLLETDTIKPEDSRRFLEMIARQTERLNNLVEDLLSLARLESEFDKNEINLVRSNLIQVVIASVTACQEKSDRKQVTINYVCEPKLEANLNGTQLEQALINLIDNAIKYSESGSTIDIEAKTTSDEISISVTDTGLGISSEHLPRLFERFYRVDQARSRAAGGTGLGLAIVKHIALAHGGRVEVTSQLGQGSAFTIYLPAL